jgi:hypothetical protein
MGKIELGPFFCGSGVGIETGLSGGLDADEDQDRHQ